jgi:hypothetical protein
LQELAIVCRSPWVGHNRFVFPAAVVPYVWYAAHPLAQATTTTDLSDAVDAVRLFKPPS